jgi:hypothetical protein
VKKKSPIQVLKNKVEQLEGHDILNLHYAKEYLKALSTDHYMASGLIVEIKNLSGSSKIKVCISDGLSKETIKELTNDINRTLDTRLGYLGVKRGT